MGYILPLFLYIITCTMPLCKQYIQYVTPIKYNECSIFYIDTRMNISILKTYQKGRGYMISYSPLWSTMEKLGITKYQLIYHWGISSNTLRRMGHGDPINSNTLNELCLILNCNVEDILKFEPTQEELTAVRQRKEEIIAFRKKKVKK